MKNQPNIARFMFIVVAVNLNRVFTFKFEQSTQCVDI